MRPQRVFLYRMMTDEGHAPNIQGGICSLALCKPQIRKSAQIGDIIIGLRARSGAIGSLDTSSKNSVLYVMQVSHKMTLEEYALWCRLFCPEKIPSATNPIGDCQYDEKLNLRPFGSHCTENVQTDISGKYVLLGRSFAYRKYPVGHPLSHALTEEWCIDSVTRGHRVKTCNEQTYREFASWLASFPKVATSTTTTSKHLGHSITNKRKCS